LTELQADFALEADSCLLFRRPERIS
jgi:hypothetical protein